MASNSFGTLFRITTWGESHGRAIGVVIDGCPAGMALSEADIQKELELRRPGKSVYTSPRKEPDRAEIFSGVFEGKTTGAPISIIIFNQDTDSSAYESMKSLHRPGHASYTYQKKYQTFDYRGGGRASARETACRVAAGAVAKKLLQSFSIDIAAFLSQVGDIVVDMNTPLEQLVQEKQKSAIFCPDQAATAEMEQKITALQKEGDSIGGTVSVVTSALPVGLGDPIYEKLQAKLSHGMLTLPAAKAIAFGSGFQAAFSRGSEHNDGFHSKEGVVQLASNNCGGILGGISTGSPLVFEVVFKPTSSIRKKQKTTTFDGKETFLEQPENARHDPCVAIRAVTVVEAMTALVLADCLLLDRTRRL